VVDAELPETYSAFKSQQFRWAKGSVQTAKKLMVTVMNSPISLLAKAQAAFHLLHYVAHLMMFTLALLALPLTLLVPQFSGLGWSIFLIVPLVLSTLGPSILYLTSQRYLYPEKWTERIFWLPSMVTIGFGICISNTRAVLEAVFGVKSGFVRTPKSGEVIKKTYKTKIEWIPIAEIFASLYCLATMISFVVQGVPGGLIFFLFYGYGFLKTGVCSLSEQRVKA